MKYIILFFILLFPLISFSQIKFVASDDRPDLEIQVYQNQDKQLIDTVFILTQNGIEKSVKITECYQIVYAKSKKHEGKLFYGLPVFFVKEDNHYSNKVIPIAVYAQNPLRVIDFNWSTPTPFYFNQN